MRVYRSTTQLGAEPVRLFSIVIADVVVESRERMIGAATSIDHFPCQQRFPLQPPDVGSRQ